jgi:hypothetical protein
LNARVLFWQNEIFLPVAIAGSRSKLVGSSVAVEVNRIESSWKIHINRYNNSDHLGGKTRAQIINGKLTRVTLALVQQTDLLSILEMT